MVWSRIGWRIGETRAGNAKSEIKHDFTAGRNRGFRTLKLDFHMPLLIYKTQVTRTEEVGLSRPTFLREGTGILSAVDGSYGARLPRPLALRDRTSTPFLPHLSPQLRRPPCKPTECGAKETVVQRAAVCSSRLRQPNHYRDQRCDPKKNPVCFAGVSRPASRSSPCV